MNAITGDESALNTNEITATTGAQWIEKVTNGATGITVVPGKKLHLRTA